MPDAGPAPREVLRGLLRSVVRLVPKHERPEQLGLPEDAPLSDLIVTRAYVDVGAMTEGTDAQLIAAVRADPDLLARLEGPPDATSYVRLGGVLGSPEDALRLMTLLIALRRAKLYHLGSVVRRASAGEIRDCANMGFLSLVAVNLGELPARTVN